MRHRTVLCMDTAAANRLTEDLARHYIVSGQSRLSTVGLHYVDMRSPVKRLWVKERVRWVLSTGTNMDDEKQTKTQWAENWSGPSSRRETVPANCLSVGEASIPFSNVVKTLGVTLDAELSMEQNISAVDQPSDLVFFQIRPLSKVSPYITYKAASSIDVCLILSKLDYCNSLLSGLPPKQIKRLQAVQNAAARTVMKCKKQKQNRSHHSHS